MWTAILFLALCIVVYRLIQVEGSVEDAVERTRGLRRDLDRLTATLAATVGPLASEIGEATAGARRLQRDVDRLATRLGMAPGPGEVTPKEPLAVPAPMPPRLAAEGAAPPSRPARATVPVEPAAAPTPIPAQPAEPPTPSPASPVLPSGATEPAPSAAPPSAPPAPPAPVPVSPLAPAPPAPPAPVPVSPPPSAPARSQATAPAAATPSPRPAGTRPTTVDHRGAGTPPAKGPALGAAIEELVGLRMYVWIGAVALALAGALLVKYTIDQGVLTPAVRVVLGVLFGLALLAGGDRARHGTPRVGAGLSASGVAVLFASFYAATTVYAFVPPAVGFILMGLTAGAGVLLSLRQGPGVAAVGLMGGFLTPALVSSGAEPQPAPLFIYLFLLQAAMTQVARRRGWWSMTALSALAGLLWVGAWITGTFHPGDALWIQVYLIAATGNLVAAAGRRDESGAEGRAPTWLPMASAFATLLLSAVVVHLAGCTWQDWAVVALLGVACLVLGRLQRVYEVLPWVAATVTGTSLLAWSLRSDLPQPVTVPALGVTIHPFVLTACLFGALYAGGAYAALWGARRPALWSAMSAIALVGFYLLAFGGRFLDELGFFSPGLDVRPWGSGALALTALAVAAAVPPHRRRMLLAEGATVVTAPLAAAATLFAIGVPFVLSHAPLGRAWSLDVVAWSLDLLAVVWAAHRFDLPLLRRLAWPLGALVAAVLLTPVALVIPWGAHRMLTWLLVGYGVPIVLVALAARFAQRDGAYRLSAALQWGAMLLGFAGISLGVRQWFHPAELRAREGGLVEAGTYAAMWLATGVALIVSARRWRLPVVLAGGGSAVAVGLAGAFVGPVLLYNPLWTDVALGPWPVVNWLLYPFGLPAVLAVVAARAARAAGLRELASASTGSWLTLAAILVGLEVRHGFHLGSQLGSQLPSHLAAGGLGLIEAGTYPVAWLLLGLVLLRLRQRWPQDVPAEGAASVVGLGLVATGAPLLLVNPLWTTDLVGRWPVVNWLLYAFGLPAVLAFFAARALRRSGAVNLDFAPTAVWLGLTTALVGLEVRHAFHLATPLGTGGLGLIEGATYSGVWILLGLALLRALQRLPEDVPVGGAQAIVGLGLAAVIVPLVVVNPLWTKDLAGPWPVANWLLYAFGMPAGLALVASRAFRRAGPRGLDAAATAIWLVLATVLVGLEVRHAFHLEAPLGRGSMGLVESATYAVAWIVLGLVLLRARDRWPHDVPAIGAQSVLGLGLAAVGVPLIVTNPLWNHLAVGSRPGLNALPYAFGLPAVLAAIAARELRRTGAHRWSIPAAGALAVGLGFVMFNLLVRQGFHGTYLDTGGLSVPENYTYSLVWVLYGVALLLSGIAGGGRLVRWASLAVMLLAVGKVFLYDTANLRDLYRVVSFLGLGLSLMALGWVYQRFVFRAEEPR